MFFNFNVHINLIEMSEQNSSDEDTKTSDLVEEIEVKQTEDEETEEAISEIKEQKEVEDKIDIENLIDRYKNTNKNKERAKIIDQISEHLDNKQIKELLIQIVMNDKYPLCRAKAVSNLGYWIEEEEIREIILKKLTDISPKVRLWVIWTLRPVIRLKEIQEKIINQIKFIEKSRQIKLWMIRILSDQIDDPYIQETFLFFFRLHQDTETKKLLLYYLLQKIENEDILFTISRHVQYEKNSEIRLEIVKRLLSVDEPDVKYILEKLSKTERNKEILELLRITL